LNGVTTVEAVILVLSSSPPLTVSNSAAAVTPSVAATPPVLAVDEELDYGKTVTMQCLKLYIAADSAADLDYSLLYAAQNKISQIWPVGYHMQQRKVPQIWLVCYHM
jgi:hypothetical protein